MRRLLRSLLLSMLLVLAVPAAMLAFLSSESGTAWTLERASELVRTLGMELEYGRIHGSLLRRLEIHGLVLVMGDSRFEAGRALLDWRPAALLGRTLHVRALEIGDVRLVPPAPVDSAPAPLEIPELRLPLTVRLDRLLVERLTVEQPEADLAVSRLALAARLDRQGLAVTELQFAADGAQLLGAFRLGADAPHPLEGELSARIDERLVGDDH